MIEVEAKDYIYIDSDFNVSDDMPIEDALDYYESSIIYKEAYGEQFFYFSKERTKELEVLYRERKDAEEEEEEE